MKYRVKFNEEVDNEMVQGGVSFSSNKAIILDSEEVELFPWFLGNPTFTCEEIKDEASKTETDATDAIADNDAGSAGEDTVADDEAADSDQAGSDEVAPTPAPTKRTRKKAASK